MKLRRPSPALVISCIALVVACTGTAFAATIIKSSNQIKNGVVGSQDIKDGTIQGVDIKKASITADKLKGAPAAAAAAGPSTAYHLIRKSGPIGAANLVSQVATLSVPAGAYKITASTVMAAINSPPGLLDDLLRQGASPGGRCRLDAAGEATESLQNVLTGQRQAPATFYMQTTRTVGTPADIKLECSAGVPFILSETSIIATKVSDIVLTQPAG